MRRYLVIDTHADEYTAKEVTYSMTVKQLIDILQGYPGDMPVLVGNNRQSYNDWYTYGAINTDRVIDIIEQDDTEDDD